MDDIEVDTDDDESGRPMNQWHLDKRVPVALIVFLLIQVVGFAWFAAKLEARVSALENKDQSDSAYVTARFKLADERYERLMTERDRMARVEEQIKAQGDTLHRIEQKLDGMPGTAR